VFIRKTVKRVGEKTYQSVLLVESYRENGRVKQRTLLNLSKYPRELLERLEVALKNDASTVPLVPTDQIELLSGESIGALWVFQQLAKDMGILDSLDSQSARVLFLIIGRILTQGSRLRLLDWGKTQALGAIHGLSGEISLKSLYTTLDWLSENQEAIEERLFKRRCKKITPKLFLYDVTSSYVEGNCNELAAFGYNRDGKKGKKQVVIGLMTDEDGVPVAVKVFQGNTQDVKTVEDQIKTLAYRFGVKEVTLVGDRGMLKSGSINMLAERGFSYITAITKPQIETLIAQQGIQLDLFSESLSEVFVDGVRYILKRNPVRAKEMKENRDQKIYTISQEIEKQNVYLVEHSKAKVIVSVKQLEQRIQKLKLQSILSIAIGEENKLTLQINQDVLSKAGLLDGCYVIKTNVDAETLSTKSVHERYKDLAQVEKAFRTLKTGFLEIRPLFLQKESRTRGHVFISMLAYMLIHEFKKRTCNLNMTLEHMVDLLDRVQTVRVQVAGQTLMNRIPQPPQETKTILEALKISLPAVA
jgi:transposase